MNMMWDNFIQSFSSIFSVFGGDAILHVWSEVSSYNFYVGYEWNASLSDGVSKHEVCDSLDLARGLVPPLEAPVKAKLVAMWDSLSTCFRGNWDANFPLFLCFVFSIILFPIFMHLVVCCFPNFSSLEYAPHDPIF